MNGYEIAVAAVAFILIGFGLCALAVFCVWMILMMRKLQAAAEQVSRVAHEALGQIDVIVKDVKVISERHFGDQSAIAKAARSVSALSDKLPEIMGGLKIFNETFSNIYRTAFEPPKMNTTQAPPRALNDESAFIPYSEAAAADEERNVAARRERLVLSDEELAGMRTDREPVPESPTPES